MSEQTPEPNLPVAVVADAHVGGPGGDGAELAEQLHGLASDNCQLLLMMGDLFQNWIGHRRFETETIHRLLSVLEGVAGRGVPIVYIEGNRDFFLGESPFAGAFESITLEHSFELRGTRYLAVHGDGINRSDWKYLFWRWLSKNPVSHFTSRLLPARLARSIVESTESRLSRTNSEHRLELPEEAIRSYAERRLSEGFDVVLMGHFHERCEWRVEGGEVRIFDAWYNRRCLEWLSP